MKKLVFTAFAVGLSLTASLWAQVPSYIPTNGLVGWYPFNGNANDESGLGTNGVINAAVLSSDRFGSVNSSYFFNGINSSIDLGINPSINSILNDFTLSYWVKIGVSPGGGVVISSYSNQNSSSWRFISRFEVSGNATDYQVNTVWQSSLLYTSNLQLNQWVNYTFTRQGGNTKIYIDGILINSFNLSSGSMSNPSSPAATTKLGVNLAGAGTEFFNGNIDDFGIWSRALTQQEITDLYNSCQGSNISLQPSNTTLAIGSSAQFSTNAASGSTYQWQSNPLNTGWINLINNSTYSGVTSNTMTVTNTTVSNHNQPFRAIVNTGGCIDTSDVANIIVGDTCLTTVTDTLIINTTLSLPAPNNENTILIYPNPASDHINIDNGNFAAMAGYTIKIENNAGQQVFQSAITQAQFYVDLSTWTGNGLYFVHLIDPQNNTVTVRKIVLQ